MDAWTIYGVAMADDVKCAAVILTVVLGLAFVVTAVISIDDWHDEVKPWLRRIAAGFALALTIATFTPCSKTIAAMYVLPKIVHSEKVRQLGDEAYDLAIDWMKSLKPSEKAEGK